LELEANQRREGVLAIVIKPGTGVDPAKGPGPGLYGLTQVNSGQPEKIKKKLRF